MNRFRRLALVALIPAATMSFGLSGALAQTPSPAPAASASPSPAPSASPSPAASAPAQRPRPAPSPAAIARGQRLAQPGGTAARRSRHAAPVQTADPFGEEITLEPKKVVIVKGTANWDSAFDTLIDAFKALNALLDKQGIKPRRQFDDRLHLDRRHRLHLPGRDPGRAGPEEPDQGHEHRQIARGQGAEIRPSRLLRQHGQHL